MSERASEQMTFELRPEEREEAIWGKSIPGPETGTHVRGRGKGGVAGSQLIRRSR